MVYTCFVCKWRGDKFPRRSFHKFPSNAGLKQKWLDLLGKSHVSIGARTSLCSIHFEEDCFRYGLVNGRRILKDGSIPSLYLTYEKQKVSTDLLEIQHPESHIQSTFHTENPTEVTQTFEQQTYTKETDSHDELPDMSMYDGEEPSLSQDTRKENVKTRSALQCSVCNHAITESQYTCVQCSALWLCGACEARGAHHHHYVLRVPANSPKDEVQLVLATIRRHLKDLHSKTENDWDDPTSIKSEVKSEGEEEDETTPAACHGSDSNVPWAACKQEEHANCFTDVRIKLESVNESDTVHFSSADECESNDSTDKPRGANGTVIKPKRDAAPAYGTSYSYPTSSPSTVDALDGATSAKKMCIRPVNFIGSDTKAMESRVPRDEERSEGTDAADNFVDHTSLTKITSIKLRSNFTKMHSVEFTRNYRMTKRTVVEICNQIEKCLKFNSNRNECLSPVEQLLIALRYYGTGAHLQKIAQAHGVSLSTASRAVKKVSSSIAQLKNKYIYMPTSYVDVERCQREFRSVAKLPYIIGCIDCTHVRIQSPGGQHCDIFKNNKGYFSVNVQTVTDSKLKIRDVIAHSPGSTSDAGVFEDSPLRQRFENGDYGDSCLLGDSAYPLKNYLLTPFLQTRTEAQENYNKSHSETRKAVEKLNTMLKRRFPALAVGLRINLQTAVDMVIACCILHNVCIENGEDVPPPDIDNSDLAAHIEHGRIDNIYDEPGDEDRRNAIISKMISGRDTP